MRTPRKIYYSDDVYLATRSAMFSILRLENQEKIKTVAMPGMGTLTGQIEPEVAVHEMLLGIGDARLAYFKESSSHEL